LGPHTIEARRLEADQSRWQQAYREHGPSILAFLTSRLGRREVAEEFLQETFVRAMRRGAAAPTGPSLRSYLFTTAHHLVLSDRRRARPQPIADLSEADLEAATRPRAVASPSPEAALDLARVRARLDAALDALSPDHRRAFRDAVLEQRPYAAIARTRGWTIEQVKINVHRARKSVVAQLRDLLRPAPAQESAS
jgi:RNA polymerase sigma-70 factor (ECF subfamily)